MVATCLHFFCSSFTGPIAELTRQVRRLVRLIRVNHDDFLLCLALQLGNFFRLKLRANCEIEVAKLTEQFDDVKFLREPLTRIYEEVVAIIGFEARAEAVEDTIAL